MRITETDYAYLLRTLSEARSRATEISVAVRSRVGSGHRLSELGNSAVSQIEELLRQVRTIATEESETTAPETIRPSRAETIDPPVPQPVKKDATSAAGPDSNSQHWFPGFVNEILEQFGSAGEISFETVEQALAARKEAFLKDIEVARRMQRTYPQLFKELEPRTR